MRTLLTSATLLFVASTWWIHTVAAGETTHPTKSNISIWVDPETPADRQMYTNSRGRSWNLVMSDEFNMPNRSFRPGDDHLWTSLEKPDGVNGALQIYSHNMTSTACDDDDTCYFFIKTIEDVQTIRVYNSFTHPPSFMSADFFYRAAMVQSWNKFCFQGGMIEVRAQLPGAVSPESGNPDLALGKTGKVESGAFYPTWPGIWMMGNLGRAIFSASTNRMWPFSYNKCEPDVFNPDFQRISACNSNPGYGLNPNQGRGAPEIDILEGGGLAISSSLQIAPGMPMNFRLFPADKKIDSANIYCIYDATNGCKTEGANNLDVPTEYYMSKRGHKSWYQGLRYGANNFCAGNAAQMQSYDTIAASLKKGITDNKCTIKTCPASGDVNADLDLIDGKGSEHWGINTNGTCFPVINTYMGAYLCDPDNQNELCVSPRNDSTPPSNTMKPFNYQMDAISSNWPVQLGAYTDYLVYQLEWVTGENGYVRWMLDGFPIFEVTTDAFSNVPQDTAKSNPVKVMLEEPMYMIFNVALSRSWGATPPNIGSACRGDGTNDQTNRICDSFPMYLKIDYIRLYQDFGDDLDKDNLMQVGCDPDTHPTRGWIEGHLDEFQDDDNPMVTVAGKAFCTTDDDCTVGGTTVGKLVTGRCENNRCECTYPTAWGGPRCTTSFAESTSSKTATRVYGPPMEVAMGVSAVTIVLTFLAVWASVRAMAQQAQQVLKATQEKTAAAATVRGSTDFNETSKVQLKDNYSQNFV